MLRFSISWWNHELSRRDYSSVIICIAFSNIIFANIFKIKIINDYYYYNNKYFITAHIIVILVVITIIEHNVVGQGELTISSDMENLMESLFMDHVPESWTKLAYPSLLGLAAWFSDLCLRLTELENWSGDFNVSLLVSYIYISVCFSLIFLVTSDWEEKHV